MLTWVVLSRVEWLVVDGLGVWWLPGADGCRRADEGACGRHCWMRWKASWKKSADAPTEREDAIGADSSADLAVTGVGHRPLRGDAA